MGVEAGQKESGETVELLGDGVLHGTARGPPVSAAGCCCLSGIIMSIVLFRDFVDGRAPAGHGPAPALC